MGTEKFKSKVKHGINKDFHVKLNNPLMGTEKPLTTGFATIIMTVVKLNNPLMGTEKP